MIDFFLPCPPHPHLAAPGAEAAEGALFADDERAAAAGDPSPAHHPVNHGPAGHPEHRQRRVFCRGLNFHAISCSHGRCQPRRPVHLVDVSELVADQIGQVNPHVEHQSAALLHVPPGGDVDAAAATEGVVPGQVRFADGSLFQQEVHQPGGGIAAVVLGHRQLAAVAFGRVDHAPAGSHGDRQRFLHQHVQSQFQRFTTDFVVHRWIGHHVHGSQVGHLSRHFLQVCEGRRPRAQQSLCFLSGVFGVLSIQVADARQFHVAKRGLRQLRQPDEVANSHAAAADQSQFYLFHLLLAFSDGVCFSTIWTFIIGLSTKFADVDIEIHHSKEAVYGNEKQS